MWLKTTYAHWFNHVNAVNAAKPMKDWLTDAGSMTKKLKAHSVDFSVRHVSQTMGACSREESHALGAGLRTRVMQREVILLCDNQPVIYGHTSVVSDAMRRDWPFMATLGNVPLGEKLFTDTRIIRQPLQYARLHGSHPLMQRAANALGLGQMTSALYARRSIFCRKDGAMLVTEIFLPAITDVMAIKSDI
jgi:chorismate--pyruvate lyase